MIQQIHLGVRARSEKDSKLLSRVLAALGLKHRDVESRGKRRSPCFFPPSVALEILAPGTGDADSDLELALSDPDSAAEILARMGLEITDDSSGPEPAHSARRFRLRLPGGTRLKIVGARITRRPATEAAVLEGGLSARGLRFAIVASRFNSFIVERLLLGALDALERAGAGRETIEIVRVPGSLEIPSTARRLAESKRYDAIICLGCLLRGDTAHYDVIANEVTRGIGQSAQETAMPHAFGVLTCDTLEQAIDRAGLKMGNKGFEAALAAIEMANLNQSLRGRTPSKNISGSASAKSGRRRSHASSSVATKRSRGKSRR